MQLINAIKNLPTQKFITHGFYWMLYILFELLTFYLSTGNVGSVWKNVMYYSLNVGVFYCQTWLLMICLGGSKRRYGNLVVGILAELVVFNSLKLGVDYYFINFTDSSMTIPQFIKSLGALDLFRSIQFAICGALYWAGLNMAAAQQQIAVAAIRELADSREKAELESRLAKSQNAYLKQQINPHLLLNSLNFVFSSVFRHSAEAADSVLLLADLMRFSLEATDDDGKIELLKETKQLENLIRINQYRFDYPMSINFTMEGNFSGHRIIPLVLMTLSENIFKHGDLRERMATLSLAVTEGGLLTYRSINYKRPRPREGRLKSIGLENIRIRLDYAYGDGYQLNIHDGEDIYETNLEVQL